MGFIKRLLLGIRGVGRVTTNFREDGNHRVTVERDSETSPSLDAAALAAIEGFAQCLVDARQAGKVRQPLADLLGQRIFGIAYGHPDGNDADRLGDDPIHKLLLGRDPVTGEALASQPTVSRFENHVGRQELYAMGCELATRVLERPARNSPDGWPPRLRRHRF